MRSDQSALPVVADERTNMVADSSPYRPAPANGINRTPPFSYITGNWRGKPLISHQVIVELIAATTTKNGLKVRCELGRNIYPAGINVSSAELDAVNLTPHVFHGEWHYTIRPKMLALQP
jgi:hypothetical protein